MILFCRSALLSASPSVPLRMSVQPQANQTRTPGATHEIAAEAQPASGDAFSPGKGSDIPSVSNS